MTREYLCQYGNCQVRLPQHQTYVIGKPHGLGAPRFCSPGHAILSLAKDIKADGPTLHDFLYEVAGMLVEGRDDVREKRERALRLLKTLDS